MKWANPKLKQKLEHCFDPILLEKQAEQEEKTTYQQFVLLEWAGKSLENADVTGCKFSNCRFPGANCAHSSFVDTVFINCDFSNVDFQDCYFQRCSFLQCRMVGADFSQSMIKMVLFQENNMDFVNFDHLQATGMRIEETSMKSSHIIQNKWKQVELKQVDFTQANFLHTMLNGMDFRKCRIDGILVSGKELKGVIVDRFQASELARLLGIIILEE